MWFFRFFFNGPLQKIVERFLPPKAILDTDEPSSDRLIQEGWPLLRRLPFFSVWRPLMPGLNCEGSSHEGPESQILLGNGYCLKKHRLDVPLDSQGSLAYFECVFRLENP